MTTEQGIASLRARLEAISPKAAINFDDVMASIVVPLDANTSSLGVLFIWADTKQGHEYWSLLDDAIGFNYK